MAIHRRALVTNAKFIYKADEQQLMGKLKYFSYRNDRNEHIPQQDENGEALRRWEDRGLGDSYKSIFANAQELGTNSLRQDLSARTLVISPQMEFMAAVPEAARESILKELTESTLENWFDKMDKPCPEYSYVLHRGEVQNERPEGFEQPKEEFLHTHVVLAASLEGLQGREAYPVFKDHLDLLHKAGAEEMERIWTRELGVERVQELNESLEELTQRLQKHDAQKHEMEAAQRQPTEPNQRELDETSAEINSLLGLPNPPDMQERLDSYLAQAPVASIAAPAAGQPNLDLELNQFAARLGLPLPVPELESPETARLPEPGGIDLEF